MGRSFPRDLFLAIDVGTGSVRSALVNVNGNLVAFQAKEHAQIVPRSGWAEQRPRQWWEGAVETTRAVLQSVAGADRVAAGAACGRMHGTVLIDTDGEPVLDAVPLWNDKRTRDLVEKVQRDQAMEDLLQITANPPAVAWQAFKLAWIKENHPRCVEFGPAIKPNPAWTVTYERLGKLFDDLHEASQGFYDRLDEPVG